VTVKDYQRKRVYRWEDAVVGPRCSAMVPFAAGQTYVNGVWLAQGWLKPPRVVPISTRQRKHLARASHGQIELPVNVPGWVVLHELAHSLTDDGHGPNFMGMYIDLLERVEGLSRLLTMYSLKQARIDFNLGVQPLGWVIKR